MKYSEAKQGRVFVLRLEDGDILHEEIEAFAKTKNITAAAVLVLGGANQGSSLVVGPRDGQTFPIDPMVHTLTNVHETTGTGTIFCNKNGDPILHMHIASGREESTVTGCVRTGVKVWQVMEVIIFELVDTSACRVLDSKIGAELLQP